MSGGSKQEQLEHRLDHKLNASSDGIDMDVPAKVISSETVYTCLLYTSGLTSNEHTYHWLALSWGTEAFLLKEDYHDKSRKDLMVYTDKVLSLIHI